MADQVLQLGKFLMDVDMFPAFFLAHFIIASSLVREDSKDLGPTFRQDHPFTMWVCAVVAGLSGGWIMQFMFGDPLLEMLKETSLIVFLTFIWYMMNYSPFDIVYKAALSPPVILPASILQECMRVRFIYLGLQKAAQLYPGSYFIIIAGGAINGNGYGFIKLTERLIRGKWTPKENDLLEVSYFTKSGIYASIVFLLHHTGVMTSPIEVTYLATCVVFSVNRMVIMVLQVKDPLLQLEKPVCQLLFGGSAGKGLDEKKPVEAKGKEEQKKEKRKDEKKKDK